MPNWTAYVRERLRMSGVRPANEQDVIDDLAAQLDEAFRDAMSRGLSPADAEAAAAKHITDWPALARQVEDARRAGTRLDRLELRVGDAAAAGNARAGLLAGVLHDVRFAARLARQSPGFTAVAVLTLALGIGANTTIFSWINAVLVHPLPGVDAGRIVDVGFESKTFAYTAMSYPDFVDLRSASPALEGLLVHNLQPASLAGPSGAERIWTETVSDNFFDVLGVTPVAGRGFTIEEGRGPVPVTAVRERLARERFGDPAAAIGKAVDINGTPFTIVGVIPEAFSSGYTGLVADVWLPIQMSFAVMPGDNRVSLRGNHWLDSLGRLKPGATAAQAAAELTGGTNQIAKAQGVSPDGRMTVTPLWRSTRGAQSVLGPVLLVLMAMVAIVLLITCANLANLLLSRASARRREFAVRLSLGCPRARLVRQLLTEALLLVAVAALAAIVAQRWTSGLLMWFVPSTEFPISLETPLDLRVALFAASAAFVSALMFGVAPALQASRTDLAGFLKSDRGQIGRGGARLRNALVVAQVAFSLLLLVSAGLFGRSLQNARVFDPGFKPDHVLLRSVDLFAAGYDRARGSQTLARILDDIRALPGVESATIARRVPLGISTGNSSTSLEVEGYSAPQDDPAWAYLNWVGPDYFRTMGIKVIAGHEYTTADRPDQQEVFVVNRAFAKRFWQDANPIGKRIRFGKNWYEVAGVVADSKYRRLSEPASPFVYLSTTWNYRPDVVFHVRTTGDPKLLAEPVRAIIHRADAKLPVFGPVTLEEHIQSASFQQRLGASLLSAFGALAVLLASIGLYATIAYSVSRRTRELGARLAMGATRGDIMRLVLSQAARLTAIGLAVGLGLAIGAAQLFGSLLVGVRPVDPATLIAVTLLLSVIAIVASYVPARRAARLDPLQALRYE
ncbi:MAG TPA: ABC transporter permease [Vicinamibacterales bacterium]|nr:ABC transporter permease [Vicinamibacterales bacterium]